MRKRLMSLPREARICKEWDSLTRVWICAVTKCM